LIIAEPHLWDINLYDKTGRHAVDPGPTFVAHYPLFVWESSAEILKLEVGREMAFFIDRDAKQLSETTIEGVGCRALQLRIENRIITLYIAKANEVPFQIETRGGPHDVTLRYEIYEADLTPDLSKFEPPSGISFIESANPSHTSAIDSIGSEFDFDAYIHTYYLSPNPDLIDAAIRFIGKNGLVSDEAAAIGFTAFFAEVFEQNENRVAAWDLVIAQQDHPTQQLFSTAKSLSLRSFIRDAPPSPELNDLCWAGFFASGRTEYLERIIRNLSYVEERSDLNLYLTGASAKWSLASNAASHPTVRMVIEESRANAGEERKELLGEVLSKSPGTITTEMTEILKSQKDSGVW
jgi:hypothetical protein